MIRPLLGKEIREHGLVLAAAGVLAGLTFALSVIGNLRSELPVFTLLQTHLLTVVPLYSWYLGGRLVRREYSAATQLFLDALPVSRAAVVTAKLLTGALALFVYIAPAYAICVLLAGHRQDVSAGLLAIVSVRALVFTWLVYAAGFVLGFLGRYRAPLLIVASIATAFVVGRTEMEFLDFGPLALVGPTFPSERGDLPLTLVLVSAGAAAALTALAYGLASLAEGSVAARLAHAMTQRERAFMGAIVVASVFAIAMLDQKREKAPFDPPVAADERTPGLRVAVGAGSAMSADEARRLAANVHTRLDAARTALGIDTLDPVFLFSRRGLDANRYEPGTIEHEAGIVVRVGYPAEGWDEGRFVAWLARRVVADHTKRRALLERRRWVLDGFGAACALDATPDAPFGDDPKLLLRALHGAPDGVRVEDLRSWDSLRERVGDPLACGVAWSGLRAMARTYGRDRAAAFVSGALGPVPPDDVRALWYEAREGVEDLVARHTGATYEAFVAAWDADLAAARSARAAELEAVPRVTAELRVVATSDSSREVEFTARLDPSPGTGARVRFEWATLGCFDDEVGEQEFESESTDADAAASGARVHRTFTKGARIAWRVVHRAAALGCDVGSPLRRTVLE